MLLPPIFCMKKQLLYNKNPSMLSNVRGSSGAYGILPELLNYYYLLQINIVPLCALFFLFVSLPDIPVDGKFVCALSHIRNSDVCTPVTTAWYYYLYLYMLYLVD